MIIAVARRVLSASVINLLIEMRNMKMVKALKIENEQNKLLILKKFNENWNKAETWSGANLSKKQGPFQRN